ncbi:MAG: CRTAC1 family protein [Roseobacter sp.]
MKYFAVFFAVCAQVCSADVKFENRSDALPKHQYDGGWEHFVGGGIAVFDCNTDALPDIFAAGGENPAILLRNDGEFNFSSIALPRLTGVTGAYPIDVDADGHLDLFVLRVGDNVILKGAPDCQFSIGSDLLDVPQADDWSTAFTAWWEDETAPPVMAVGNYVDRSNEQGPFEACDTNVILRAENGSYRREILRPGFCPLSILAAKDARGRMALRLSNDRHYYVRDGFEQMWDIDQKRFLSEVDGWPTVSLWGMGIAGRDLNGDGRDEVMLTSMGDQVLQFAQPDGSYQAAPFGLGTYAQRPHTGDDGRPSTGWHAEFGDVDNDGRADLFLAKGNVDQMPGMATRDPNNLLVQNADGTFAEVSLEAGVASMARSRGAALADFDGDGKLDLLVSNRRAPLELYKNVSSEVGNWVKVDLRQTGGNRHAIGARISVQTESGVQTVQNVIGGGHAGGQLLPRHFGLGAAETGLITVDWPDGSQTTLQGHAGETHVIRKP